MCYSRSLCQCSPAVPGTAEQFLLSWSCSTSRSQTKVPVLPQTVQFIFQVSVSHQTSREETIFQFSAFWFLLLPAILLFFILMESFCPLGFPKKVWQVHALHVLSLNDFITIFDLFCSGATQGLYGCVVFSPSTGCLFVFFKQKDESGGANGWKEGLEQPHNAFFSLFPCLPSSVAHEVVIHGAFCQSSGWVWLTPEHSVPCLLFCGTAQDPFWYSFEMV